MNDDFLCTLVQDPHNNVIFHVFAMCWDSTYPLFLFPGNRRKSMEAFSNPYYYGRANTWAIKHNGKEVVRATGLLSLLVIVSWISNTNKYHIYHKQFARYVSPHLSHFWSPAVLGLLRLVAGVLRRTMSKKVIV